MQIALGLPSGGRTAVRPQHGRHGRRGVSSDRIGKLRMNAILKFAATCAFAWVALAATGCCCCCKKKSDTAAPPAQPTRSTRDAADIACSERIERERREAAWEAHALRVEGANDAARLRASR